jgi:lipoyl-dependent peroxiredoxin subunit D
MVFKQTSYVLVTGKKAKKQSKLIYLKGNIMSLNEYAENIPDYGKDIRLNLDTILTAAGAPGLTVNQIAGIALACGYAVLDTKLSKVLEEYFVSAEQQLFISAKSAATIMAMNNIYYRFLHLADDKEFSKMPARLRMNVIGRPGVEKVDFELMSLAVSAISGCGMCINTHIEEVRKAGISNEGIQSAIRIAAVINAAKTATFIAKG